MNPDKRKGLQFFYQRAMFYAANVAANELRKPLFALNEMALLTLLLDKWGVDVQPLWYVTIYLFLLVAFVVIGKIMVVMGMVKYNSTLGNYQNPEFMAIVDQLNRIEQKVGEKIYTTYGAVGANHNHCYRQDGTCYGAYAPDGGCRARCHDEKNKNCWHFTQKDEQDRV